jgi:hypothetical protein
MNPLSKVAERCRQLLTEQQISASGPGTILTDIQTMIEFIGVGGFADQEQSGELAFLYAARTEP